MVVGALALAMALAITRVGVVELGKEQVSGPAAIMARALALARVLAVALALGKVSEKATAREMAVEKAMATAAGNSA